MHRKNITGEKYFLLIAEYEISQCGRFANAVYCRTPLQIFVGLKKEFCGVKNGRIEGCQPS
jgi:hypothetical protein